MKIEDMKVGQTLQCIGGDNNYTVKYASCHLFVVERNGQETSYYPYMAKGFSPYTPPIQVTAYVYFYLQGADQRPVHRLCYDETQLANLRAQDSVKHKLSPVTTVKTEFK